MHSKVHIKAFITSKTATPKTYQDVGQLHKFFETYLKYLALTVIRLNGGKYKEARSYISHSWIPCSEEQLSKMLLKLFNQKASNKQYWKQLLAKNKKLKIYLELLFQYAAKVRNLVFHGNYYPFKEGEEDFIYNIYIGALDALEKEIATHKKGNCILDNNPTEFGAAKGTLTTLGQFKNILPFKSADLPYSYEKAQQVYHNN